MLELEHGFRVVDVNARLDPDRDEVEVHGREITPERLEREMQQAGVVRAVVTPRISDPPRGYLKANNAVARMSVDRPFYAFARINGARDASGSPASRIRNLAASRSEKHTSPEDVEQYAYDDRFHGFALAPAEDGLPDRHVLDQLEDVGLPVLVHAGEQFRPSTAAETLLDRTFPVILSSFGGYPLNRDLMRQALSLLSTYDRLYLDTSHVRYRSLLEQGLREHPDRVLFGTGAPDVHPDVSVMEILTLDVPEDAMRRAFSKNPSRVVEALAP